MVSGQPQDALAANARPPASARCFSMHARLRQREFSERTTTLFPGEVPTTSQCTDGTHLLRVHVPKLDVLGARDGGRPVVLDQLVEGGKLDHPEEELAQGVPQDLEVLHPVPAAHRQREVPGGALAHPDQEGPLVLVRQQLLCVRTRDAAVVPAETAGQRRGYESTWRRRAPYLRSRKLGSRVTPRVVGVRDWGAGLTNVTPSTRLANSHGERDRFSYPSAGLTLFEEPIFLLAAAHLATAVQNTATVGKKDDASNSISESWGHQRKLTCVSACFRRHHALRGSLQTELME